MHKNKTKQTNKQKQKKQTNKQKQNKVDKQTKSYIELSSCNSFIRSHFRLNFYFHRILSKQKITFGTNLPNLILPYPGGFQHRFRKKLS